MLCRPTGPRLVRIALGCVGALTTLSALCLALSLWRQVSVFAGPASVTVERSTTRLTIERHPLFPQWGFAAVQTRQQRDRWWFSVRTDPAPNWSLDLFLPAWFGPTLVALGTSALFLRRLRPHRQHCSSCGYSLAGLPHRAACPECGGLATDVTAMPNHPALSLTRTRVRCSRFLFFSSAGVIALAVFSLFVQTEVTFDRSTMFVRAGCVETIAGRLSLDPGVTVLFHQNTLHPTRWWMKRDVVEGHSRTTWPLWPLPAVLALAAAVPHLTALAARTPSPARRRSPPAPPRR